MADAGIFGEDDRVELLDGEIVEMAPVGSRHAACVNKLTQLFVERSEGRALLAPRNPITLGERSEPQPDLALLRPRADYYASGHPTPDEVLLVVEVGDTTAEWDRRHKLPLYAAAGVAEVWLVDLAAPSRRGESRLRAGMPRWSGPGPVTAWPRWRCLSSRWRCAT